MKIPKRSSETVNLSRTYNAMVNRNITKEETTSYKTLHRKLMIEQNEPP